MPGLRKNRISERLEEGFRKGVYPGAVLLVALRDGIVHFEAVGQRSLIPRAAPMHRDTIFDLASLTKPLGTGLCFMKLVDDGTLSLDQPLETFLSKTLPPDKRSIRLRWILGHTAGFPDWRPFYLELVQYPREERKQRLRDLIAKEPMAYGPRKACVYSDLGFMFLEWVIEDVTGMPMHRFLHQRFYSPLSLQKTFFSNSSRAMEFAKDSFAATEDCPWRRRVIQGEAHDENAYAVGGYSGHAGLFGTAEEVYVLVDFLRAHFRREREDYFRPETVEAFFRTQDTVKGCTWALSWDTPTPLHSSSGKHFSSRSVGHLGYTGTSIWMDLEKDVIVILLTNRVHPTRTNEGLKAFRPGLHDVVMEELGVV